MIDPNCHASRHTDPAPVKHVRGMTTLGHYAASPMQVSTRQHHHIQLACYGRVCGELPALTPQGAEQSVYLCAGQLVADTAAAAGVKVFVFSTLEDVEKRSKVRSSELHKTTGGYSDAASLLRKSGLQAVELIVSQCLPVSGPPLVGH